MNISVIIAAAGAGTRFGGNTPKQYLQIDGVTVLEKALNAFCSFKEIIIVTSDAQTTRRIAVRWLNKLRAENRELPHISIVRGGAERQDSVYNALTEVTCEYVLVHDAARPFVSEEVIGNVCEALEGGADAVIPCVKPKDTIRTAEKTLKRSELYSVQTPQGFKTDVLKAAYENARANGLAVT
ncbi:MAG: 2-C-methyl-D-erythritol 4-phosphate cytidylyltransferase, partial [Firmicutes bacterium]|nr:2-C-methyl-D-erythritol 4-phosphate cytidylyltransferase [Bacillota bacterium]